MTFTDPDLELEGAGVALSAFVKLSTSVDTLADQLRRRGLERHPAPVFYRTARQDVAGASGLLSFNLGGPDQGHFWYVRSVKVGGLTVSTVAAGLADVYVSAAQLSDVANTEPSLLDWRDRSTRLPGVAFYGRGEIELRMSEELQVRMSGLTNGQAYIAVAEIEDYQEHAGPQTWDL